MSDDWGLIDPAWLAAARRDMPAFDEEPDQPVLFITGERGWHAVSAAEWDALVEREASVPAQDHTE